ncbi:hypothetical protein C8R43DRAFT_965330 [Mycena crocata]|nr:hypothetical protein C8R43DRAFT_965330 [Mycena crocata]
MPKPTATQIRLENITTSFAGPVNCLKILANTLQAPLLAPISSTAESLLNALQSVQQNKAECVYLMEKTYSLLYAIISLYTKPESGPDFPFSVLDNLAKFIKTLHKMHTYVEAQQNKSKIRQLFRHGEMSGLLKDCKNDLQGAVDVFKVGISVVTFVKDVDMLKEVADMNKYAEQRHNELLKLIETISDGTDTDHRSLDNNGRIDEQELL